MEMEGGNSFIPMQGNDESDAERMHMVWVSKFQHSYFQRQMKNGGDARDTVTWKLLKLVSSRKLQEPRTKGLKTDQMIYKKNQSKLLTGRITSK